MVEIIRVNRLQFQIAAHKLKFQKGNEVWIEVHKDHVKFLTSDGNSVERVERVAIVEEPKDG